MEEKINKGGLINYIDTQITNEATVNYKELRPRRSTRKKKIDYNKSQESDLEPAPCQGL